MVTFNEMVIAANQFGAVKIETLISWTWAYFDNYKSASEFDLWCMENNVETRGVYEPAGRFKDWGVRFR